MAPQQQMLTTVARTTTTKTQHLQVVVVSCFNLSKYLSLLVFCCCLYRATNCSVGILFLALQGKRWAQLCCALSWLLVVVFVILSQRSNFSKLICNVENNYFYDRCGHFFIVVVIVITWLLVGVQGGSRHNFWNLILI